MQLCWVVVCTLQCRVKLLWRGACRKIVNQISTQLTHCCFFVCVGNSVSNLTYYFDDRILLRYGRKYGGRTFLPVCFKFPFVFDCLWATAAWNKIIDWLIDWLINWLKLSFVWLRYFWISYEGCSINKLQNDIILLIFKILQIWKYTFCREFNWGHILEFLWRWRHYCDVTCT